MLSDEVLDGLQIVFELLSDSDRASVSSTCHTLHKRIDAYYEAQCESPFGLTDDLTQVIISMTGVGAFAMMSTLSRKTRYYVAFKCRELRWRLALAWHHKHGLVLSHEQCNRCSGHATLIGGDGILCCQLHQVDNIQYKKLRKCVLCDKKWQHIQNKCAECDHEFQKYTYRCDPSRGTGCCHHNKQQLPVVCACSPQTVGRDPTWQAANSLSCEVLDHVGYRPKQFAICSDGKHADKTGKWFWFTDYESVPFACHHCLKSVFTGKSYCMSCVVLPRWN